MPDAAGDDDAAIHAALAAVAEQCPERYPEVDIRLPEPGGFARKSVAELLGTLDGWNPRPILTLALCVAVSAGGHASPRYSELDKYQTPVPFPGVRGSHITCNLGPTGMRGWIDWNHPVSHDASPSREILIRSVEVTCTLEAWAAH